MCYKKMPKRNVLFAEANQMCINDNAQLLQVNDWSFGLILEDQMNSLTRYYMQPTEEYESWVTFSGGSGPNYVILFDDGHHYGTAANGIMRFKANKKADVMCMYKPEETIVSVAAKAEKLKPYYHPSVLTDTMSVWRSSGLYTASNLPNHDVCEASMKAIIGSNHGTLMGMSPHETKQLSPELRDSFVQTFVPFYDCSDRNIYRTYFKRKDTQTHEFCTAWPPLQQNDYKAQFNTGDHSSSFVFYPINTGGYDIMRKRNAVYGAMLCGFMHVPPPVPQLKCSDGWEIFERNPGEFICHKFFMERVLK